MRFQCPDFDALPMNSNSASPSSFEEYTYATPFKLHESNVSADVGVTYEKDAGFEEWLPHSELCKA